MNIIYDFLSIFDGTFFLYDGGGGGTEEFRND